MRDFERQSFTLYDNTLFAVGPLSLGLQPVTAPIYNFFDKPQGTKDAINKASILSPILKTIFDTNITKPNSTSLDCDFVIQSIKLKLWATTSSALFTPTETTRTTSVLPNTDYPFPFINIITGGVFDLSINGKSVHAQCGLFGLLDSITIGGESAIATNSTFKSMARSLYIRGAGEHQPFNIRVSKNDYLSSTLKFINLLTSTQNQVFRLCVALKGYKENAILQ